MSNPVSLLPTPVSVASALTSTSISRNVHFGALPQLSHGIISYLLHVATVSVEIGCHGMQSHTPYRIVEQVEQKGSMPLHSPRVRYNVHSKRSSFLAGLTKFFALLRMDRKRSFSSGGLGAVGHTGSMLQWTWSLWVLDIYHSSSALV